ncbi:MAG: hypothetical protein JNL13_13835 [Chitinophagaceae bacterium]|nr:hypothetical protein [Chitinophagaceae bacterium]
MKKITITLLALLCLDSVASAQAVPKTKTKNREQQGVMMSDTPNTIAPVTPADRTRNNNTTSPRTDPALPTRSNPDNNNTKQQQQNSMDTQPLNRNSSGQNERNTDMQRNRSDINMNTNDILGSPTPSTPPPMSK